MDSPLKVPFYAKASLTFIGLFAFVGMLYIGQSLIVPLIYSTIIAIVLSPLVTALVKRGFNRVLAERILLQLNETDETSDSVDN